MSSNGLRMGVVGPGAIGTAIAGRLALSGQQISVVARGARRDSILREGLRFRENGEARIARVPVVGLSDLADRDLVIIATKSTALPDLLPQLLPVLAPATQVMPAVNGLPWWYFCGDGPLSGTVLRSIDPSGELLHLFDPDRLIGCTVYTPASMGDDGQVEVLGRQRLKIGSVGSRGLPRAISEQLSAAGIVVSVEDDIRREVWVKLIRNASTNLVSALTHATLEQIGADSELLTIVRTIAREVVSLSKRVNCVADVDLDEVMAEIRGAGPVATSMLQDVRARRQPELDAIAGAPLELAALVGHPMPALHQTAALLRARLRYLAGQ